MFDKCFGIERKAYRYVYMFILIKFFKCFVINVKVGIQESMHGPWSTAKILSTSLANDVPDSKVHGAHMGPIWGRQDPGGPMNLAIWGYI